MKREWKLFWGGIVFSTFYVVLIAALGWRFDTITLLPDTGAAWYYWKLPTRQFWPMATAWGGYALHQISFWFLLYRQRRCDPAERARGNGLLLAANGFFILLHLLQSHVWYDGLAQDVPVFSSQGSVILMLVFILIMETDRRGLVLGKKLKGFARIKAFIRSYHGYYIAWAITYTFWYHPTVSTPGHLFGFFYMMLLFLQGSLPYTEVHRNKYWRFVLEVLVLAHGTAVAVVQGNGMWPMFCFGFGMMAVLTQLYGIGLNRYVRLGLQGAYAIGVILVYGILGIKEIGMVHQITWIPVVEYGLVFVFLFAGEGMLRVFRWQPRRTPAPTSEG